MMNLQLAKGTYTQHLAYSRQASKGGGGGGRERQVEGHRTWYGQYGHSHVGFFEFTILRMHNCNLSIVGVVA